MLLKLAFIFDKVFKGLTDTRIEKMKVKIKYFFDDF